MNPLHKLHVGIDGRSFSSPAAGVRRYVSGLVPALSALDEPLDIVALGGAPDAVPSGLSYVHEPWHPGTNAGWNIVGLPRAAARAGVDVIHAPAYTAPLWSRIPTVLTIHDVSYERHPEWYPYRRDKLRRLFYKRSARAAAHVLTDSEFSAGEIVAAYSIPRERITVAPLGVSARFTPGHAGAADPLPTGVGSRFLLHVGDLHERRNLTVVVKALLQVRRRLHAPGTSLVLAGIDHGVGDRLRQLAKQGKAPDAVVCLGTVTDDQLLALYRRASALVYPSRYEGFGLPVLEAMACGTPVIASRAASIPEVLGDAGILLDPDNVRAWAEAIGYVLQDDELRLGMSGQGRIRASQFTWERTARLTFEVYHVVNRTARR